MFGSLAYSVAISIKMSVLLAAPGVALVLLQALPGSRAINMTFIMMQVQMLLAIPFLSVNSKSYFSRAFDLSRQFLFKWTVNWRFLSEETFLSKRFSIALLVLNLTILSFFAFTRWTMPSNASFPDLIRRTLKSLFPKGQQQILLNVNADFILTTILTSLMIGLLCARSLHYQFFAYISWSTPFLLWKSRMPGYLVYAVWGLQEVAWNVYPSTSCSSLLIVSCLTLQVAGTWWGTRHGFSKKEPSSNPSATVQKNSRQST